MADLAPKLQTDVTPIGTVEAPSVAGGLSSILSGLLPTKELKADSMDAIKKQDTIAFNQAMDSARQAKEQGNGAAADRMAKEAFRTYGSKYGYSDEDVNTSFQNFTGIPVNVATGGEAVGDTELMKSADYAGSYALAQSMNPDADPEQIHQIAIGNVKKKAANAFAISQVEQQKSVDWLDVEQVYVDKAQLAGQDIIALLAGSDKDKVITPEEASAIRKAYMDNFGNTQKPMSVPDDRWKAYKENYIDPISTAVETAIGLGQAGEAQDVNRALTMIVKKAISQDKLPPSLLAGLGQGPDGKWANAISILQAAQSDPALTGDFLKNYNLVLTGSMSDLMGLVQEFPEKTPEDFSKVDLTNYKAMEPTEKEKALLATPSAIGSASGDPGFLAMNAYDIAAKVEALDTVALKPTTLGRVFNPSYFKAIDKIYKDNPVVGLDLADKTIRAVASQKAAVTQAFVARAAQRGLIIENGELKPDLNDPRSKRAQDYVDKVFGGSWDKAAAAKGVPEGGLTRSSGSAGYVDYVGFMSYKNTLKEETALFTSVSKQLDILQKSLPKAEEEVVAGGGGSGSESTSTSATPIGDKLGIDFSALEAENGLPQGWLERTAYIESGGDPTAVSSTGATGVFQLTKGFAKQYNVKDRNDPVQNTDGAVDGAVDAMNRMTKALGRKPTGAEIYLAHQQGISGAIQLLTNPNALATDIVGKQAIVVNAGKEGMTAGQFANFWMDRWNNAPTVPPTAGKPSDANAVAAKSGEAVQRTMEDYVAPSGGLELSAGGSVAPSATPAPVDTQMPQEAPKEAPVEGSTAVGEVPVTMAGRALLAALGGSADKVFKTVEEMDAATDLTPGDVVQVGGEVFVIRPDGSKRKVGDNVLQ